MDDPLYAAWLRVRHRFPKWPGTFSECVADNIILRQLRIEVRAPAPQVVKRSSWANLPQPRSVGVDVKRRASGEKDDE